MSAQSAAPSNWNLPNALTTLRIVAVPFYGWALLAGDGEDAWLRCLAWLIFFVAMVTDKIDGDIARSRGLVTNFGKIADPIADKALTGMAFIGLSILGEIWWWVTIVVLLREWSVTVLRLSILKKVVIAAADLGKLKTATQAFALGFLTLPLRDPDLPNWLQTPGEVIHGGAIALLVVAVVLTVWSGYEFFAGVWKQRLSLRTTG